MQSNKFVATYRDEQYVLVAARWGRRQRGGRGRGHRGWGCRRGANRARHRRAVQRRRGLARPCLHVTNARGEGPYIADPSGNAGGAAGVGTASALRLPLTLARQTTSLVAVVACVDIARTGTIARPCMGLPNNERCQHDEKERGGVDGHRRRGVSSHRAREGSG